MTKGLRFSILIVDDDSEDRQIIDEAFVEIGYECEVKKFITGKDLLQYLEKVGPGLLPTLIVLDNTLPEMDAGDLLRILKKNESYQNIPVIVYSSHCTSSKTAELKALGAYNCVEKGNTMQAIIEMAKTFKSVSRTDVQDVD
jgi:CheY-like chemotaxis protein